MTKNLIHLILTVCAGCLFLSSCDKIQKFTAQGKAKELKLETEEEKMSYILGWILSENTKKSESRLQSQAFVKGVQDNLNGQPPALSQEEMTALSQKIRKQAEEKQQALMKEKHKMDGSTFLEENKKKEGVKVTESGLQYEVLSEGKGKSPTAESEVEVHYRGTLIDGTEFDSSYKRNATASFPLNRVIKGWTEGLQLMKEGAKYKFYVPSDLAYGARGQGKIPPHSTLIFEVELIKVK